MPRSIVDGHLSDDSLGSFCLLPEVDEAEARLQPTVALPKRKKRKAGKGRDRDNDRAVKRHEPNRRQSPRRESQPEPAPTQPQPGRCGRKNRTDDCHPQGLLQENERLWDDVLRLENRVQQMKKHLESGAERIHALEATCKHQKDVIRVQAQGLAYRGDKIDWQQVLTRAANAGRPRDPRLSTGGKGGPGGKGQAALAPQPIKPYAGLVTVKTEADLVVKREPALPPTPPTPPSPLSPSVTMDIDRLTIHDKHPTLESMERIRRTLGQCIDEMKGLQDGRLMHPHRDYRALCAAHYDVTMQIRQLERLCAKATP